MKTDCEQFKGRLRDLCEGVGRDGRPQPSRRAVDAFRQHHGLPPDALRETAAERPVITNRPSTPRPMPVLVGNILAGLFRKLGVADCIPGGCQSTRNKMNYDGLKGCRENRGEYIAEIRERAKHISIAAWTMAIAKSITSGLALRINPLDPIASLYDEALRVAEKEGGASTLPSLPPNQVAIVIAGRNSAQWLPEAIESALSQSYPCEVVYADDCSTDDSVTVAQTYESRGLRVLPSGVHAGVCDARNRGTSATVAPYVMVLDSDDVLTPTYAEDCLREMRSNTPFVYSTAHYFGAMHGAANCPEWERGDIYNTNHVNTSALWARWALDLAGGWIETTSAWDWDLVLRTAKYGTPVKSGAVLKYRRHTDSWSYNHALKSQVDTFRKRHSLLSVVVKLDGKDARQINTILESVVNSVRQAEQRAELIVCGASSERTSIYRKHFTAIRHLGAIDDRHILGDAAGNLVWLVNAENLPQMQECRNAIAEMTTGPTPPTHVVTDSQQRFFRRNIP